MCHSIQTASNYSPKAVEGAVKIRGACMPILIDLFVRKAEQGGVTVVNVQNMMAAREMGREYQAGEREMEIDIDSAMKWHNK